MVDAGRVGLWGTSLGGGHVFAAAAADPSIKAVVSQLGFADGERIVTRNMTEVEKQAFAATLDRMHEKKKSTGREMFVPITKVLTDDQSKAFVEANRQSHPSMNIKIPFLTVREMLSYKPREYAMHVACPVLVVVAGEDIVNPKDDGIDLYNAVSSATKRLYVVPNAGHYDVYDQPHFESTVTEQVKWFSAHL